MTKVRVWLSHDGYRDPDDNLAMLVGAAQARDAAKSSSNVSVAAVVFGDTTDGGQYLIVNPRDTPPARFGSDSRFADVSKNLVAAGNYAFFKKYGSTAISELAPGWDQYDLIAENPSALRSWNYDATGRWQITKASRDLADDIEAAIRKGGGSNPNEVVVYSAGGGQHVPAEAIGYLVNEGYTWSTLQNHFRVIQHGTSNFSRNTEKEARDITRTYTVAISDQDNDVYANGMLGPGLRWLTRNGQSLDGDGYGSSFKKALRVAQGIDSFQNLGPNKTFKATKDASDAGSHAFASDITALMKGWDRRLKSGDDLPYGEQYSHLIEEGGNDYRLRIIYRKFDWKDAQELLNGGSSSSSAPSTGGGGGGTKAPFSRSGESYSLGGADLFAFKPSGAAGKIGVNDGKIGVVGVGDRGTVDRNSNDKSEMIGIDFGRDAEGISIRLKNLDTSGKVTEAARMIVYDADGDRISAHYLRNYNNDIDFNEDARYVTLTAARWQPNGSDAAGEPDFALAAINLDWA